MNTPRGGCFSLSRTASAALVALAVAGCASEPKIEYVPFEVRVPVPVPCAAAVPAEPSWAAEMMPRVDPKTGEGIDVATDLLVIERNQRRGYEAKLRAATEGCR